ncbi:YlcI/YnfO family protein [Rhodanobacter geophilus]|uniref:YlcI/YnfO family protein n=1 Tax=Rhodanobacter geophilus TaxID=3162488 RepID=A0ABV3QRC1_9GAMM
MGALDAELLRAAEAVLNEGESLSAFVEASVRAQVARRRQRRDFVAKGSAAAEAAQRTGQYTDAAQVLTRLLQQASKGKANR